MESVETIPLAGIQKILAEQTGLRKYYFLFDKTGNAATFLNYQGTLIDFYKNYLKVVAERQTIPEALDVLRGAWVGAMLHGKHFAINLDKERPDFTNEWKGDDSNLPEWVFDYEECDKFERYIKLVRESENISLTGDKGNYFRAKQFTMSFILNYISEEDVANIQKLVPYGDQFKVYILQ